METQGRKAVALALCRVERPSKGERMPFLLLGLLGLLGLTLAGSRYAELTTRR